MDSLEEDWWPGRGGMSSGLQVTKSSGPLEEKVMPL